MSDDKRVWMYRKGESKLFDSPDAVPKSEGWTDSPAAGDPEPPSKRSKIKRDETVKMDDEADDDSA